MTESIFFKIPHIVTKCFVTLPRHERVGKGSFGSRRFRSLVAKLLQAITTPLLYHTLQCIMYYILMYYVLCKTEGCDNTEAVTLLCHIGKTAPGYYHSLTELYNILLAPSGALIAIPTYY